MGWKERETETEKAREGNIERAMKKEFEREKISK